MNPWITGRIVEAMQQEARRQAAEARTHRTARARPPRRARLGLAVARVGWRIAGPDARAAAPPERWNRAWATHGAPSPSR